MSVVTVEDPNVKHCQQRITKLDLEIRAVVQDIQRCTGPLVKLEELNKIVAKNLSELKSKIQELENLGFEQDKETSKIAVLKNVEIYSKQTNGIQNLLRKANLACQLAMEKKNTSDLFSNKSGSESLSDVRKRPVVIHKDSAISSQSNITQSLINLTQMMADEVKHSEKTLGVLLSSSDQIKETHEELKNASGHIRNAKKLLTKYGRREFTDKLLIIIALIFYFASCLYVIKKRLWTNT
ncbi:hypothetical protein HELRODRAFT_162197 [Helobdella robusta]|uniref:Sec20 C-terminal domain-containing protein n=1 Tax=Helobdella robusta TaxID=6412 RepID=T1ESC4_HELRO|nr:hypothetical protein HELRODRAFT_162197 [Helobdella robusta]ESN98746.1 hypothetical protein HELRODRAFT_162197 [Helobdella robusta]